MNINDFDIFNFIVFVRYYNFKLKIDDFEIEIFQNFILFFLHRLVYYLPLPIIPLIHRHIKVMILLMLVHRLVLVAIIMMVVMVVVDPMDPRIVVTAHNI